MGRRSDRYEGGCVLFPAPSNLIELPEDQTPLLMVVVDTEAEFDWGKPLSRLATSVRSVRHQVRAHGIFERYRIIPTYAVDYAVASQADGFRPLRELLDDERCIIGAHLQPWENPPFEEDIGDRRNSYAGNLPARLEREKLLRLTEAIETSFEVRPRIYRAGRFGVGPSTADLLTALGYLVDTSVVPNTDFSSDGGPDFAACGVTPFWCGPGDQLLEIPLTVGFTGLLRKSGASLHRALTGPLAQQLHLPGIMARLRLLDRVRLSPEGIAIEELIRLTRTMLRSGHRLFSFTYHSPSLQPGNLAYVQSDDDLRVFLDRFEAFFDFFFGEVGGRAITPLGFRELALQLKERPLGARDGAKRTGLTPAEASS
jgi:hypothetical protein